MTDLATMPYDELYDRWAALLAYVDDNHQVQYALGEVRWQIVEKAFWAMNEASAPRTEDRIIFNAFGTMLEQFDYQDMTDEDWAVADRVLAEHTAAVETRAGSTSLTTPA